MDADGRFCGLDAGLEHHPYLYFVDITKGEDLLSTAVCVSKCPMEDDQPIDCINTSVETDCANTPSVLRYNSTLLFTKACLPILSELPEEAVAKYKEIVGGLGVNDIGQGIDDMMNSWPIYCVALVSTFIVT